MPENQKDRYTHNPRRLTDAQSPPDLRQIESWIGEKAFIFWERVTALIDRRYPGIFDPEWLYGVKKHGWSLRYKKSKSFCTMIPEKDCFLLLIVLGGEERNRFETIRCTLSARTVAAYNETVTYHDGKWLLLNIDCDDAFADAEKLLFLKRKPAGKTERYEP